MKRILPEWTIPGLLTILCLIPFLPKAFHIDDPLYLWAAKQILKSPFDFYGFTVNWYGYQQPIAQVINHPPLVPYLIAGAGKFFGFGEIALHLFFLIPAAAAATGTYFLARKFCDQPLWAALMGIATPVFLVSGTTVMVDMFMLAFWVWALNFWIRGITKNKAADLLIASVLMGFCALAKYFGIAVVGLAFIYALAKKRRWCPWVFFLCYPVILFVQTEWMTSWRYGKGVFSAASDFALRYGWSSGKSLIQKLNIGLSFLGAGFFTGLCLLPFAAPKRIILTAILLTGMLMGLWIYSGDVSFQVFIKRTDPGIFLPQLALAMIAGVSLVWLILQDVLKNKGPESFVLACWILGTLVFACFINWSITARTFLPMAPAVGILLARRLSACLHPHQRTQKNPVLIIPLLTSLIVSLAACAADTSWAGSARTAAKSIMEKYGGKPGRMVWFQGHWGFQYYMELEGARPVDIRWGHVPAGDLLIVPAHNTNTHLPPEDRFELKETLEVNTLPWITVMHPIAGAGFYSEYAGPLPFAFGNLPPENFYVYKARDPV